jgi:hypothetical protein
MMVSLLFTLPLEYTGDGACHAVGGAIDGDEQVGIRVLALHVVRRTQDYVDLTPFIPATPVAVGVREPDNDAADPCPETTQHEAEPAFHLGVQALGHLGVARANVYLHRRPLSGAAAPPLHRLGRLFSTAE